jgi:hypothetical protein
MRRMTRKRTHRAGRLLAGLAAALTVAALPLAGCGVRPTGTVYAGEAPVATGPAAPQAQVYFLLQGVATPVSRPVDPKDTQTVFDTLLAGPTPEEQAKGLVSELTTVRRISVFALGGNALVVATDPPMGELTSGALIQLACTSSGLPEHLVLKSPFLGREDPPYGRLACAGVRSPSRPIPQTGPVPRRISRGDTP